MIELKLPELGENIETAEISRLLVAEGDVVEAEQSLMELESEKASFPLPSPQAGRIAKVLVKEGDTVSVGQTLLEIAENKAAATTARTSSSGGRDARKQANREDQPEPAADKAARERSDQEEEQPEPATDKAERAPRSDKEREAAAAKTNGAAHTRDGHHDKAESEKEADRRDRTAHVRRGSESPPRRPQSTEPHESRLVPAGPATRRLARELGVDLHDLTGSGPGGRIVREDVKAFVHERMQAPHTAVSSMAAPALPDFSRWGSITRQRLSPLTRTAAERLALAWRLVPHVTQHDDADITELEAARKRYQNSKQDEDPKITVTVLAVKAVVAALKEFPHFNSSLDTRTQELIIKDYYHIGVAVDTDHGLLVPVLRDADKKSTRALAADLAKLADKARNKSLSPQDMEGGTFTISNLGGIGGTAFTPIVNYPEVAILGLSRARWQHVDDNGTPARRLRLPVSLSYDHRVINGADGARFLARVAQLLADPFLLLLGC
jgi:pyruvate dehydrogenase E2 component (dihydrolipoamide acetyltransferase)